MATFPLFICISLVCSPFWSSISFPGAGLSLKVLSLFICFSSLCLPYRNLLEFKEFNLIKRSIAGFIFLAISSFVWNSTNTNLGGRETKFGRTNVSSERWSRAQEGFAIEDFLSSPINSYQLLLVIAISRARRASSNWLIEYHLRSRLPQRIQGTISSR